MDIKWFSLRLKQKSCIERAYIVYWVRLSTKYIYRGCTVGIDRPTWWIQLRWIQIWAREESWMPLDAARNLIWRKWNRRNDPTVIRACKYGEQKRMRKRFRRRTRRNANGRKMPSTERNVQRFKCGKRIKGYREARVKTQVWTRVGSPPVARVRTCKN